MAVKWLLLTDPNRLRSGRNEHFEVIGPSRVSLVVSYACYSAGYVLRNSKSIRQNVIAENLHGNPKGGKYEFLERHVNKCYSLLNDLIQELSTEIVKELDSAFQARQ